MRLLWLIPTVIAMNWLQRNKQLHGSLDEGIQETRVAYTATTGQTLKQVSAFFQFPITISPFSPPPGPTPTPTPTTTNTTLEEPCLRVTDGLWSGWVANLNSAELKACYDFETTGVCVEKEGKVQLECHDLCQNVAISNNKFTSPPFVTCEANLDAMYTLPVSASQCIEWSPNSTVTMYYRLRLATGVPTKVYVDLYDRYCSILLSSTLVDIAPNPTCFYALTVQPSLPTSDVQAYAFNIGFCNRIEVIEHCEPRRDIVNEWVLLPVESIQDDQVEACWDSGSVPVCVYRSTVGEKLGYTYSCSDWCWIDTLWFATDAGSLPAVNPTFQTCVAPPIGGGAKGLDAPLELGEAVAYKQLGWCNQNDELLGPGPLPYVRITPFYRLNVTAPNDVVTLRVEVFSTSGCMVKTTQVIEESNFCFNENKRRTYGRCNALEPLWNGVDQYGCGLRHVVERESNERAYYDQKDLCDAAPPIPCNGVCQSPGPCPVGCIPECNIPCGVGPGFCVVNPAFLQPFANHLEKRVLPNEVAPHTISCLQSGGSPYCQFRQGGPQGPSGYFGACDDMCYWTVQYACLPQQCGPNGGLEALDGGRQNPLFHAGHCGTINFKSSSSDYTVADVPPGDWVDITHVRGWYYDSKTAFRFSRARGCDINTGTAMTIYSMLQTFLPESCWSNDPESCYTSPISTAEIIMKTATCEDACGQDGYGCTFQSSSGEVSGLAQLSCPTSQACLAGCGPLLGLGGAQLLVECIGPAGLYPLTGSCICNPIIPISSKGYNYTDHDDFLDKMAQHATFIDISDKRPPRVLNDRTARPKRNAKRVADMEELGCALGVALVLDLGQNPVLSLVDETPLVIPQLYVIFATLYEITLDAPTDASLIPFVYNSLEDQTWLPQSLNVGQQVLLLAKYVCHNITMDITIDYDGTFNYLI